jgi:hypothetical protein
MNRGIRKLRRLSQHGFIIMTLSSLGLSVQEDSLVSKMLLITSFIIPQCLTTGPWSLAKRVLHTVPPRSSAFNFQHPLLSLRESRSCLRLLLFRPVTPILPSNFPSIVCFRRQFLLPESSKLCPMIGIFK